MASRNAVSFIIRCVLLIALLGLSILQITFFTFIPNVRLHIDQCNATLASKTLYSATSPALQTPMHYFYRSLHLPQKLLINDYHPSRATDVESIETKYRQHIKKSILKSEFLYPTSGQDRDPIPFTAFSCINLIVPSDSLGIALDFEMYSQYLPSSRLIYVPENNRMILPPSVIDLYLERHPSDKKYYPESFQIPRGKTVWLMMNVEFFDRHELTNPDIGVLIVKNRIGLKKVVEYRHRHRLGFSVFYTKHTSKDMYQPAIPRDWDSFLHLAGWSPFKNTKVVLLAWAQHPEWPKLIVRVLKASLCQWIEERYQSSGTWGLPNVDYLCEPMSDSEKMELQNQVGIHICPSETEGFGHYINEARSVGALIITSDVAPMNELVDKTSGFLIGRSTNWWWQSRGDLFMPVARVGIVDIEKSVEQVLRLSVQERRAMGQRSRARFLEDQTYFMNAMAVLEESLCQESMRIDKLLPYLY